MDSVAQTPEAREKLPRLTDTVSIATSTAILNKIATAANEMKVRPTIIASTRAEVLEDVEEDEGDTTSTSLDVRTIIGPLKTATEKETMTGL